MITSATLASRAADLHDGPLTVFEMRHYVTQPGRRDDLIEMFETHLLDAYEAAGATVLATCRNLDDPNRWWWIRAFPSLATRDAALDGFYGGAVWRRHADACNALLADVGDARLLRPIEGAVLAEPPPRPALGTPTPDRTRIHARIVPVAANQTERFLREQAAQWTATLHRLAAEPIATLVSLPDPPNDRRRPLRRGPVVVRLVRLTDASPSEHRATGPDATVTPRSRRIETQGRPHASTETLRLAPTGRSALR